MAESLAKVFLHRIRKEKDAGALETAFTFTTDSSLRAYLAARCSELTTDPERRVALLARAYQESGDFLKPYALCLREAGKAGKAIEVLEAALRNGAAEPWVLTQLENLYRLTRNDAGLLRVLTQAIAKRPREAGPREKLSRVLEAMGRGEEALRELRLAREFRPENLQYHQSYLALAERVKAPAAIEDALFGMLERDWSNPDLQNKAAARVRELITSYRKNGKGGKARELETRLTRIWAVDLFVRLTWDTDKTDVDLHVVEPSGHETYYRSMRSERGRLDRDVVDGRGPEAYTARHAVRGTYRIGVKYYHGSKKTKATVVVTRHKGSPDEVSETHQVQLKQSGDTAKVVEIKWP
jgi:tetratricopeptide (TPR) repeat protein